jgi:PKD repeat protein
VLRSGFAISRHRRATSSTAKRSLLALVFGVLAVLPLLGAAPAQAAKVVTASFTVAPNPTLTNRIVTFTSTSAATSTNVEIVSQQWDLDNNGVFDNATGPVAARAFSQPGDHTVGLRITDRRGISDVATRTVSVRNTPPAASFRFSPLAPPTGQAVSFVSTSSDPDGAIASQVWDLDNDGSFDDASGPTAARSFNTPGRYTVALRVVDDRGARTDTARTVPVGDRPPVASFTRSPAFPGAGQAVTFFSTSSDPDGPIVEQAWDLDADGAFDDAIGPTASRSFPAAGSYSIGLRVTDLAGVAAVARETVAVSTFAGVSAGGLRFLSPFPIVRLTGTLTSRGTRLRRLSATVPSGALVTVRCHGRGCPFGRQTRRSSIARRGSDRATPLAHAARVLRVRRLEGRLLRFGTTVRVFVTKPGEIGKYTRFEVRRKRPPARVDRCLLPGRRAPAKCPRG